jgi:hypothetical protein
VDEHSGQESLLLLAEEVSLLCVLGLKVLDQLEVVGHVGVEDVGDDPLPELLELLVIEVGEEVGLVVPEHGYCGGGVVLLQDRPIVVLDGQSGEGVYLEQVGSSSVGYIVA